MRRLRALGNIERGCWLIDQTAPMNVVAVAQVRTMDRRLVGNALAFRDALRAFPSE